MQLIPNQHEHGLIFNNFFLPVVLHQLAHGAGFGAVDSFVLLWLFPSCFCGVAGCTALVQGARCHWEVAFFGACYKLATI